MLPNYTEIVDEFNASFEDLYTLGLSETLKVHILGCHVLEYFELEQSTMHDTNDECIESCLQMVNKRDHYVAYQAKITKDFVFPTRKERWSRLMFFSMDLTRNNF